MLPIERVFGTIQGSPGDRVPFTLSLSLYGANFAGCGLSEYYSRYNNYVCGQQAIVNELEPDIIFTPFALVKEAEAFGSVPVYLNNNAPNLMKPAVSKHSEISSIRLPRWEDHSGLNYLIECTRALAEKYRGQLPVAAICCSPTELPALIMGIEGWLDTLLFHPEEARHLMEITGEFFVEFANALFLAGASCIVTFANFSNPTIITRKIAVETMIPVLQKYYSRLKGPVIFHHGGPDILPFLDLYLKLPNLVGLVISPKDSFEDARKIAGQEIALLGNINGPLLLKANLETVNRWTENLLKSRKSDHRFILASSNADVPLETPLINLKAISRLVKHFRP